MQAAGDDFKQLVRSSTNLVDLVSDTVTLKPLHGGRSYVGLCPFHEDHNPSFNVYPDRQSYRCWVCDEGGDCFSWVMKIEKVSFPEALESLAKRARLEIPRRTAQSDVPSGPGRGEALEELLAEGCGLRRGKSDASGAADFSGCSGSQRVRGEATAD